MRNPTPNDVEKYILHCISQQNVMQAEQFLAATTLNRNQISLQSPVNQLAPNVDDIDGDIFGLLKQFEMDIVLVSGNFQHFFVKCASGLANKREFFLVNAIMDQAERNLTRRYMVHAFA